jgi:MoxR-like ATPase
MGIRETRMPAELMKMSWQKLQVDLARTGYVADRRSGDGAFLAVTLGGPLLLEGEAGVGKTEVAKTLALVAGHEADPPAML